MCISGSFLGLCNEYKRLSRLLLEIRRLKAKETILDLRIGVLWATLHPSYGLPFLKDTGKGEDIWQCNGECQL